jgi:hypothetical protein
MVRFMKNYCWIKWISLPEKIIMLDGDVVKEEIADYCANYELR